MAMPIFTDEQPEVKVRGDLFVYTYAFEGEKIEVVLTRFAALRSAALTLTMMVEPPREALIHKLETAK